MCGRLPHDTLVVGLEPDVPPALISSDVEFWFRWVGGHAYRYALVRAGKLRASAANRPPPQGGRLLSALRRVLFPHAQPIQTKQHT